MLQKNDDANIDERIKFWLATNLKSMSSLLIENMTVMVGKETDKKKEFIDDTRMDAIVWKVI